MMPSLPANLPPVAKAKLPEVYQQAKNTLQRCEKIDECQDWANKAEALASYARQAGDASLREMADRIQARAIRRCGELLRQIAPAKNQHDAKQRARTGTDTSTRTQAAADAGLSKRQKDTALRVANVPKEEFEQVVEGPAPPTISELADRGKKSAPLVDLRGRDPQEFTLSTEAQGHLRRFAEMAERTSPAAAARGAFERERESMCAHAQIVHSWLESLIDELENL